MQKTKNSHKHTRNAAYDLQSDLERLKSALADTTFDIKGRAGQVLSDSYKNVKEKSVDMQESVADYVTKKPFKSLGIAVLSGMVIGYLLRK